MTVPVSGSQLVGTAVAALGAGPLDEAALQRHVAPLFARMRAASPERIYLANHSLEVFAYYRFALAAFTVLWLLTR